MRDSHAHGKKGDVVHWLDGRDTRSVGNGRYGSEHQRPHVQPVQPGRDGREANWGRRVRWRPRRAKGIAFITVDGMGGRASLWITYTILNTWVMVRSKTVRRDLCGGSDPEASIDGSSAEAQVPQKCSKARRHSRLLSAACPTSTRFSAQGAKAVSARYRLAPLHSLPYCGVPSPPNPSGGAAGAQRVGAVRHARERVGVAGGPAWGLSREWWRRTLRVIGWPRCT